MRGTLLALLLLATGFSGCLAGDPPEPAQSEADVVLGDPLAQGALPVVASDWDLGQHVVQGDGGAYVVRVRGTAHAPDGDGPFPVVLLMHGRHATCDVAGGERRLQPGPAAMPVTRPVPSFLGYHYLTEHLAAHGIVTLSVDVNNVNDWDNEMGASTGDDYGATARARVAFLVLAALRDAQHGDGTGGLEDLAGRLDLSRVGLMGHSRGGEGVARAWVLARDQGALPDGVSLGAVFAVGPSDFHDQDVRGVPYATLLPYCDGDNFDLPGARVYDRARDRNDAPVHQFLVLGSNHNHYNTVWTDDDWGDDDPWCDPGAPESGRDDPEAQRRNGVALTGAFFRHYLGGESDLLPFLRGEAPWPVPGVVTSHRPPDARVLFRGDHSGTRLHQALVEGSVEVEACAGSTCPAKDTYTIAAQTALHWSGPGAYRLGMQAYGRDHLTFRVGVDPATVTGEELDEVKLVFRSRAAGEAVETVVPLRELGTFVPPGDGGAKTVLNTVRVALPEGVHEVALRFDGGDGVIQVTDWLLVRATPPRRGTPPAPRRPPRWSCTRRSPPGAPR